MNMSKRCIQYAPMGALLMCCTSLTIFTLEDRETQTKLQATAVLVVMLQSLATELTCSRQSYLLSSFSLLAVPVCKHQVEMQWLSSGGKWRIPIGKAYRLSTQVVDSTPSSLGGLGFGSQPTDQLSWLLILVFSSGPPHKSQDCILHSTIASFFHVLFSSLNTYHSIIWL